MSKSCQLFSFVFYIPLIFLISPYISISTLCRRHSTCYQSHFCYFIHFLGTVFHIKKGKGSFYIAQYPVRWTAQSALHSLPSLTDLFIPTPFSASPGSILARQGLRAKTKSLTFPPVSIARYSFIQLSEQGRQWRL